MNRITAIVSAAAVLALLSGCAAATTAAEPAKTEAAFPPSGASIQWIVPSAPGAGNDILARIMAPAMQESLGANIKVVNKEGGSQVIGLNYVANSKPDGLTIGYTNIPSILGRYLDPSKNAGFDRTSFTPLGSFAGNSVVIGVNKNSPYKTVEALFAAVSADPGKITVATDSRAGDDHVNLRILEQELGLDFNIVHYNSGADKISALVAGEVDFALGGVSSFFGQYKSGEIKLLSVIQEEASPFIPEVPTLTSAGYEVDAMSNNFAVSVPSDTPKAIVAALEAALKAAAGDAGVQEKLEAAATQPLWVSGADISALWEEREALIKPVIDDLLTQQ